MCIRDSLWHLVGGVDHGGYAVRGRAACRHGGSCAAGSTGTCLLYTSDAADERSSVDLGGRRIIKKKTSYDHERAPYRRIEKISQNTVNTNSIEQKEEG